MNTPLVEIKNLSLKYGDYSALQNINASFFPGKCVVICGPSGSGKSSLLRCVNKLEDFDEGDIIFNGESLKKSKNISQIRSNIGMVFQHFELYPHLSVLNNITLAPIQVKGLSKTEANKKAFKLLERVGIDDQANKYPSELSGGQQQRAAISRALALEPKLMLFDEPTSALDPEMISEVLKVMRDLADNGMSMLVVTHEMGFARDVADEVVFMDEGKIIERSSSKSFFENPRSERAKEFINKVLLKI
jgi:ABC-type polar amino acid transport system ATPase subunit